MIALVAFLYGLVMEVIDQIAMLVANEKRQNDAIYEMSKSINRLEAEIRELKKRVP